MVAALISLLLATPAAAVLGCGGHEMGTGCGHGNVARQISNEDATNDCVWYAFPARDSVQNQYPTLWQTAAILPNDTEAKALFDQINGALGQKFPNIQPRGTERSDNFDGIQYDSANDPDCWWTRTRCTTPKDDTGLKGDITTMPEPNTWGLGIDDGPNCTNTKLYDFLKQNNQKASLYYIGSNVLNWPKQATRGHEDGHEICVHTWSHPPLTTMTTEHVFAELYYTRKIIKAILGVTPLCWRPPYGDVDNRVRFIASQLNLTNNLWSDDTFDWQAGTNGVTMDTVNNNYNNVYNKAKNGTYSTHGPIVLNHEVNNNTMSEIINQYPNIKANFKYITPIATGYNLTHPYAEQDVTFPDFATYTNTPPEAGSGTGSSSAGGAGGSSASGSASSGGSATGSATKSGSSSTKPSAGNSASRSVASSGLIAAVAGLALFL